MFNIEATDAARLLESHRDHVMFLGDAIKGSDREREFKERLASIDQSLSRILRVAQVDPSHTGVMEQLMFRDDVHDHGVQSLHELSTLRVGAGDANKICVALVNPFTADKVPQVLAAIYVYKHTGEIPVLGYSGVNGHARPVYDYTYLPGDVHDILHQECRPVASTPRALIFYSITNMKIGDTKIPLLKGSGERLINGLFPFVQSGIDAGQLPYDLVASTLSPLRSLRGAYKNLELEGLDDTTLRRLAVAHLLTGRDPVQRFHGGNGILIGDVKLRANTPESHDGIGGGGVMVNYVYDLDAAVRAERLRLHRNRQYAELLAPHLVPFSATRIAGTYDLRANTAQ
ncbi:MAG: hypothetical protein EBQ96_04435 [Proteobacteria bacterium]|nr:hypothetical protein [Pseudomonadota bacterium]